jgi:hypothetical protein
LVQGAAVLAGRDVPELLEFVEIPVDQVALLVFRLAVSDAIVAVTPSHAVHTTDCRLAPGGPRPSLQLGQHRLRGCTGRWDPAGLRGYVSAHRPFVLQCVDD